MALSKQISFKFWIKQLAAITALGLFLSLGMWQLGRGTAKGEIEAAINENEVVSENPRLPIQDVESWRYKQIHLTGHYAIKKQFLLDNQVRDRTSGYNVLTPFYIDGDNVWVLVDRGWIAQGIDRGTLPDVENAGTKTQQISGRIYVPYSAAYSLGDIAEGEDSGWPRRIQFVDYDQLSIRIGKTLQPFTLRLAADEPYGFRRDWMLNNMTSSKHYGYAFQWFAMACAVVILWWLYSIKPLFEKK